MAFGGVVRDGELFFVHLVMGLMSGIYWLVVELAGVGGCRTLDAPRPFLFY